ncbi:uncharacterized protein LOC131948939 [Physella acuta]|uniref:uncharacterized protein LOC131948939 n=1 Tax=Physella acuta TaxID=109671 RepID=UPI0027DE2461|nr:uncharacterized protein LOC131948939 [Physella acuta]XP_059166653.1 uncharacterized protein LOC131948939 [Physella acuta]
MAFSIPAIQDVQLNIKENFEGTSEVKTNKGILKVQHCTKKGDHKVFIPKKEFGKYHLPKGYRSDKMIKCINVLCDLTVRITVTFISPGRHQDDPFYKLRNRKVKMFGTGTVTDIQDQPNAFENLDCLCSLCVNNYKGNGLTIVTILTACHVVFDCEEVKNTTVDFFYDDEEDIKHIKTLTGFCMRDRNIDEDTCFFQCLTGDKDLIGTLRNRLDEYEKLDTHKTLIARDDQHIVIASHPHGLCKHLTIGQWSAITDKMTFKENVDIYEMYLKSLKITTNGKEDSELNESNTPPVRTIVNEKKESALVGIECEVHFPDFTTAKCQIAIHDVRVKHIKFQLVQVGSIYIPADELYLEIVLSNGDVQKMNDDEEMVYYINDILDCTHINMKRI